MHWDRLKSIYLYLVKEVVEKINRFNIGSIVIVQEKRLIGIITERDILQKVVEHCLDPGLCKAK